MDPRGGVPLALLAPLRIARKLAGESRKLSGVSKPTTQAGGKALTSRQDQLNLRDEDWRGPCCIARDVKDRHV